MDRDTAIGLATFALVAVLLGWIIRTFVRALAGRIGPAVQAFQQEANRVAAQQQQQALGALRAAQASRTAARPPSAPPPASSRPPPAPRRPPPLEALGAAHASRRHPRGDLLRPFHGGGLLRSIVFSEALAPPIALRRPDLR